jgi:predicted lysophospholipase L1 biosynthesis ABC-type transport system permease subunit
MRLYKNVKTDNMNPHLDTLADIRQLMERSAKFLSLSGLSGVSAGGAALGGVTAAYLRVHSGEVLSYDSVDRMPIADRAELVQFLLLDAVSVLVLAIGLGAFFTIRKARRQGLSVWNPASQRLLGALLLPLVVGGIFCLGLIQYGLLWLTFPATLVFYGLALLNASKFTVRDLYWLGLCEVGLGLFSLFFTGYNLLVWATGFGLLHIVYGTAMYLKYDRPTR